MENQEQKASRLQKLREERRALQNEVKEKTIGYIVAAFGLVAALAWNEAIKSLIDQLFPSLGGGVFLKFLYAFLVTVVIVIVTVYLLRLTAKKSN